MINEQELDALNEKIDAHEKALNTIFQWKATVGGGIRVGMWFIGVMQLVTLGIISFGVNVITSNIAATSTHAVEVARLQQRFAAFETVGPRFTADMNQVSEQKLAEEMKEWVTKNTPPVWVAKELESLGKRISQLEQKP